MEAPSKFLLPRHVWAPAPSGMDIDLLGVPVDESFHPLVGEGSLVPEQFVAEPARTNRFTSEWSEIKTEAELRASFNAWAVTGGIDSGSLNRTMTFDNLFVRKTHQLVPAYRMVEPPENSHYIITAIEVGHLVQARFDSESSALSAHLAARIKQFGGEASALESKLGVDTKIHALGVVADTSKGPLRPLTEAQFVQEFSANERAAVAVRVRYTAIKNRALRDEKLEWAPSYVVHLSPGALEIEDDGTWFDTTWKLQLSCLKNKTPLRRRDYRTWRDANPALEQDGRVAQDGDSTDLVLFGDTFDGKRSVDLMSEWVELRAEEGDQVRCTLSLHTKDNPVHALRKAGEWGLVSDRVGDQGAMSRSTTIRGEGRYRFTLPVTVEISRK